MPFSQSFVVQCVLRVGYILFSTHHWYLVTDDVAQSAGLRTILKNTSP